jgi:hypothetical protein
MRRFAVRYNLPKTGAVLRTLRIGWKARNHSPIMKDTSESIRAGYWMRKICLANKNAKIMHALPADRKQRGYG